MHSALLIDEILQLVFEVVLNDNKPSLCCAARCCRAWEDPALDRIWRRLPSAVPLLSLLPGFSMTNNIIRLGPATQHTSFTTFRSYSRRVKHIVHCHPVIVNLTSIPVDLFDQMNNLQSARIESSGEFAFRMSLAPRLRTLALRVSYTKSNSTSSTMHSMLSLIEGCSSLEQLSIRGNLLGSLHAPLSRITTLRSLSLHLSSLTEQSFMTVSTFPLLVDFDVHADHLSHDCLSALPSDSPFFPALEKLKIRAQPAVAAMIVQRLPRDKLRFLHVDVIGSSLPSAFEGLFQGMATLPLHELTLEHGITADESEDTPTIISDKLFTLDHLRPLSKLSLRHFVLDSSLPPDLSDPAIEEMTRWWPLLERLELGTRTALENMEMSWESRSSLASLFALARGCKHLKNLVIALDVDSVPPDSSPVLPVFHPLTSLSISSRSRPDVPSLSTLLSGLFPSLVDVTPGFVGEYEDAWAAIQAIVLNPLHETPCRRANLETYVDSHHYDRPRSKIDPRQ